MHPKSLIAYIARTRAVIGAGVAQLEEFKRGASPGPECLPASKGSLSSIVDAEYRNQIGDALGQVHALSRAEVTAAEEDQTVDLRSDEYRELAK